MDPMVQHAKEAVVGQPQSAYRPDGEGYAGWVIQAILGYSEREEEETYRSVVDKLHVVDENNTRYNSLHLRRRVSFGIVLLVYRIGREIGIVDIISAVEVVDVGTVGIVSRTIIVGRWVRFPIRVVKPLPETIRNRTVLRESPIRPPELQEPKFRDLYKVVTQFTLTDCVAIVRSDIC